MDTVNKPFLKTSDEDTKNKLLREGFQLISESSGVWTFFNNPSTPFPSRFSEETNSLTFSNKLEI